MNRYGKIFGNLETQGKGDTMEAVKLIPALKQTIWGGQKLKALYDGTGMENIAESWVLSCHPAGPSVVADGEDAGRTLPDVLQKAGKAAVGTRSPEGDFPLLIKLIDAADRLSLQVHPDNDYAREHENEYGKTEMWYIIDAEPGAGLYSGFSQQITPDEYVRRVADDTITDVLAFHPVKKGDVFFLPAGRIHAIGKGIFIAEIQQTSDITYRIYDYNRVGADGKPRQLHTDLAKDAIDYKLYDDLKTTYTPALNQAVELVSCPYFTTSVLRIENSATRPVAAHDSFSVYICMEGAATLTDSNGNTIELHRGETCLIPAATTEVTLTPHDSALLLESYIA